MNDTVTRRKPAVAVINDYVQESSSIEDERKKRSLAMKERGFIISAETASRCAESARNIQGQTAQFFVSKSASFGHMEPIVRKVLQSISLHRQIFVLSRRSIKTCQVIRHHGLHGRLTKCWPA